MIISPVIMSVLLLLLPQIAFAQFGDFMKEIDKLSLPGAKTLGDDKIISGLKEALIVGTENTVKLTGHTDAFLKNEAIKSYCPKNFNPWIKRFNWPDSGPKLMSWWLV